MTEPKRRPGTTFIRRITRREQFVLWIAKRLGVRVFLNDMATRAVDHLAAGFESKIVPQAEKWHDLKWEEIYQDAERLGLQRYMDPPKK